MCKFGKTRRIFMQPGLACKQRRLELLDFGGGFDFREQELGYSFFF